MFDWISLSVNSVVGIITGGIAALITSWIAINKFYKEKWWDVKRQSYNTLVDTLIEIKDIYDKASDFECNVINVSDDIHFDWGGLYELNVMIRRIYILAPISLSKSTRKFIEEYLNKDKETNQAIYKENYPRFVGYVELSNDISKIIDCIVNDAKKELKFK